VQLLTKIHPELSRTRQSSSLHLDFIRVDSRYSRAQPLAEAGVNAAGYNAGLRALPFHFHPAVSRARVGNGLDDAHVAQAFVEIRVRMNASL
jgi:hypothetical protein